MTMDTFQEFAACRDSDPELFFPIGTGPQDRAQVEAAKAVCAPCLVRTRCLSWALEHAQQYGVWGGLDADERRRMITGRRRQRAG
jgi:WhiB family transcriptional regulator, redox-sensing transcriptional regulator